MSRPRIVITRLLIVLLLLATAPAAFHAAQAQDGPRSIPIVGMQPAYRLSPDGQTAAVFETAALHSNEMSPQYLAIRLIDLNSGQQVQQFTGFTDFAADVAFSPDGKTLVSYHQNGYLYVWDVASGQLIKRIPALFGSVRLLFTPDGASLISLANVNFMPQILYWDLGSGAITRVLMLRFDHFQDQLDLTSDIKQAGHYSPVALAVSPDGARLITASMNGDLWVWDPDTGESDHVVEGGDTPLFGISLLAFSPDGSTLYYLDSSGDSSVLNGLDVASQTSTTIADLGDSKVFALAPDGQSFAWIAKDASAIHVASVADPTATTDIPLTLPDTLHAQSLASYRSPQSALTYAPDGKSLVLGGFANTDSDDNMLFVIPLP